MVSSKRDAVADQTADHVPHPHPAVGVEAGGGLVQEQHRRPSDQPGGKSRRRRIPPSTLEHPIRRVGRASNWSSSAAARTRASARRSPLSRPTITRFCRPVSSLVERGVLCGDADVAPHVRRLRGPRHGRRPTPAPASGSIKVVRMRGRRWSCPPRSAPSTPRIESGRHFQIHAGRVRRSRRSACSGRRPRSSGCSSAKSFDGFLRVRLQGPWVVVRVLLLAFRTTTSSARKTSCSSAFTLGQPPLQKAPLGLGVGQLQCALVRQPARRQGRRRRRSRSARTACR